MKQQEKLLVEAFKIKVAQIIRNEWQKSGIMQMQFAKKLKIQPSLFSKIVRYELKEFTSDRLLKYILNLYPKAEITIKISKAKNRKRKK